MMHGYTVCKDPSIWHEPFKFLPDRFDEKSPNYRKFTSSEFFPFSNGTPVAIVVGLFVCLLNTICCAGERKCIGERLAMLEGPMLLACIIRRFRLYSGLLFGRALFFFLF